MTTLFTKIIQGEIPGQFVYKDELAVAFMTIQPAQPGHLLVVPIEEVDHWDDLTPALNAHLMALATKLAKVQKDVYGCKRVALNIIGLEVPHVHLHLIPINEMSDVSFGGDAFAEQADLAIEAEKIRAALAK
jgi:histidine triad (HIT) family protein